MKIREEAIVYGSGCPSSRHDVLGLILEKHYGKLLPLEEKRTRQRNRNNVIPSEQANSNPIFVQGFRPHPHITWVRGAYFSVQEQSPNHAQGQGRWGLGRGRSKET
jgi:hypothetical protein